MIGFANHSVLYNVKPSWTKRLWHRSGAEPSGGNRLRTVRKPSACRGPVLRGMRDQDPARFSRCFSHRADPHTGPATA
jgi:hypothetical protein